METPLPEFSGGNLFALRMEGDMTEQEYKRCPFCGGKSRYLAGHWNARVICDSCEFHLPPEKWEQRQAAIASREPKMRKATRDEKIVNPGVYEVPQEPPKE